MVKFHVVHYATMCFFMHLKKRNPTFHLSPSPWPTPLNTPWWRLTQLAGPPLPFPPFFLFMPEMQTAPTVILGQWGDLRLETRDKVSMAEWDKKPRACGLQTHHLTPNQLFPIFFYIIEHNPLSFLRSSHLGYFLLVSKHRFWPVLGN